MLSMLWMVWISWQGLPNPKDPVIAEFARGVVHRSELDAWIEFTGKKTEDDRFFALQELVLQKMLAAEGAQQKLATETELDVVTTWEQGAWVMAQFRREVSQTVIVPPEHLEKTLALSRSHQNRPQKVRLRNLFKRFPENASESEKKQIVDAILKLRQQLQAGADFAEVAMRESDSQTRFNKGVLGNVEAGTLRPEIDVVAFSMKPETYSEPIVTEEGVTLLFCERILPAVERSEAAFRAAISQTLHNRGEEAAWKRFLQQNAPVHPVSFDQEVLDNPEAPPHAIVARMENHALTKGSYLALLAHRNLSWQNRPPKRPALVQQYFQFQALKQRYALRAPSKPALDQRSAFLRDRHLAAKALASRLQKKSQPLEEEVIKRLFHSERKRFKNPAQYACQVIQIPMDAENTPGMAAKMFALQEQLRSGHIAFEEAVAQFSIHPSKETSGKLGWLSETDLGSQGVQLVRAVRYLAIGETSRVIEEQDHYWFIKLLAKKEETPMTFAEAKPKIEAFLGQQWVQHNEAHTVEEVLNHAGIRVTEAF